MIYSTMKSYWKQQSRQLEVTRACALVLLSVLLFPVVSDAQVWELPLELNDRNTTVQFEVDSTWHLVHGETSGISGRCWLEEPGNPFSVRAEIHFPVARFDTASESRDERMREVMGAESFPEVRLMVHSFSSKCREADFLGRNCPGELGASLTIRDVSQSLTLPIELVRSEQGFTLSGETHLTWSEFGVEDPSILIARLAPQVVVHYQVIIPNQAGNDS